MTILIFISANAVMSKWSNIRDTFIKSLKTKSGQAAKKKYVYSDNLQFLLKTVTPDETDSSIPTQPDSEDRPESQQSSTSHLDQSFPSTSKSTQESKKRTGTKRLNTVDAEILKAIQATPAESDLVDDDRAFMMSLLPTVKKLNDDDKFEFRIEVMQLLRSFKNRRLSTSLSNSHITSPRESPFSPQEENQQLLPQPATQQETPQLSSQQDSPLVVIQSVAELFSQDLYEL